MTIPSAFLPPTCHDTPDEHVKYWGMVGASVGVVAGVVVSTPTGEFTAPVTVPVLAALGWTLGGAFGLFGAAPLTCISDPNS